jgi:uncharacterized membrane protein
MIFDYVLVAILALLAGGWAIPAGVSFGLAPLGVWVAASLGSSVGIAVLVQVAGRSRDAFARRIGGDGDTRGGHRRARALLETWGVRGLAFVGTIVLGPVMTTTAAVALDVDRRRFTLWAVAATVSLSTVLTLFWDALL